MTIEYDNIIIISYYYRSIDDRELDQTKLINKFPLNFEQNKTRAMAEGLIRRSETLFCVCANNRGK